MSMHTLYQFSIFFKIDKSIYFCNSYPFWTEIDRHIHFFSWYVSIRVYVTVAVCTEPCAQYEMLTRQKMATVIMTILSHPFLSYFSSKGVYIICSTISPYLSCPLMVWDWMKFRGWIFVIVIIIKLCLSKFRWIKILLHLNLFFVIDWIKS